MMLGTQVVRFAFVLSTLSLVSACELGEPEGETEGAAEYALANPDGTLVCHKGNEISVAFAAVDNHLSHDDFLGPCAGTSAAEANVMLCHVSGKEPHEIEVAFPAVDNHLSHGDFLGPCEAL